MQRGRGTRTFTMGSPSYIQVSDSGSTGKLQNWKLRYKASSIAGGGLCKTISVSNKLTTFVAAAYLVSSALSGEHELAIYIQLTPSTLKQHNLLWHALSG